MQVQKTHRSNRILFALVIAWVAISLAIGGAAVAGGPSVTAPITITTGR